MCVLDPQAYSIIGFASRSILFIAEASRLLQQGWWASVCDHHENCMIRRAADLFQCLEHSVQKFL